MIIHSITRAEMILPPKNKKRALLTDEQDACDYEYFTRSKCGMPCFFRRRDDNEELAFSTDPRDYLL